MNTSKSEHDPQLEILKQLLLKGDMPKIEELLRGQSGFAIAKQMLLLRAQLLREPGTGPLNEQGEPDINGRDEEGRTPALLTRSFNIFQLIVRAGGDPLARDNAGRSAFDLALERKVDDMALAILQDYPSLVPADAVDAAFVQAVRQGCAGTAKKLIELGADLGQKPGGRTLLQTAPRGAEDVKRLLRAHKSGAVIDSAMGTDPQPRTRKTAPSSTVL